MKVITTTTYEVKPEIGEKFTMSAEDRVREAIAFTEAYLALFNLDARGYHMYTRKSFSGFCEKLLAVLGDDAF